VVTSTPRIEPHQWFAIVNPLAGNGCGLTDFPRISRLLREHQIHCEAVFSEHKAHAVELTVEAVRRGYRRIIVIGGDGTLHEVVNGLFLQQEVDPAEVLLAVIAVGSGNDWVRMFGIPLNYKDAIRAIHEENSFLQDVGVVTYEESKYRQSRYMANVAGAGFDAMVVRNYAHLKEKGRGGRWLYRWLVLRSFFGYKSTGIKVWVDDRLVYNDLLFSLALGIGKYNGGGIQQLPDAVADDGMFDVSLIRPIHFWHIIFRFPKLFNGRIYEIRHVLQRRGSRIRIESSPETDVEVDGELLGHSPLEFSVLRRAIRVVVSREFLDIKQS
jgi:YegS/Rv2252/BmrU family lipid kinase